MDWRTATEQDRMALYIVLKDLIWDLDWDWTKLLGVAQGKEHVLSQHFSGNFRRGRINRKTAKKFHAWLTRIYPEKEQEFQKLRAAGFKKAS